jgi:hypothetical protein
MESLKIRGLTLMSIQLKFGELLLYVRYCKLCWSLRDEQDSKQTHQFFMVSLSAEVGTMHLETKEGQPACVHQLPIAVTNA